MDNYGIKAFTKPILSGKIKSAPEDFVVEEITPDGKICTIGPGLTESMLGVKEEYIHFTLVKYNYTTLRAIAQLNHRLRISKSRIGYAGTKDKKAVTAQRISVWNTDLERLRTLSMKDLTLKDFEYSNKRLTLGDLSGNMFTIIIRGEYEVDSVKKSLDEFAAKLGGGVPNYFGPQRFGLQRPVNHLVGKQLLLGNFEGALRILLTESGKENDEATQARIFAAKNWGSWNEILKVWPRTLGVEAAILNYLVTYPTDFANAFRELPKNLRRMFIHAFQSYIFNRCLSEGMTLGVNLEEIPIVGYDSKLHGISGKIIERLLEEEQINLEMFRLPRMPELSEAGEYRQTLIFPKGFEVLEVDNKKIKIRFALKKGSYATILLYMLVGDWGE